MLSRSSALVNTGRLIGVLGAGVYRPPLTLPVDEGAVAGHRLRAVLGLDPRRCA